MLVNILHQTWIRAMLRVFATKSCVIFIFMTALMRDVTEKEKVSHYQMFHSKRGHYIKLQNYLAAGRTE